MRPGIAETLLLAVALAMDAFAVCTAAFCAGRVSGLRSSLRLSFHTGLFQAIMPVLGWLAGRSIAGWVDSWDHWIAFGLLAFVGTRMIREGGGRGESRRGDPSRGWLMITLCLATSIDALAVGFGLALLRGPILFPAVVIGVVTAGIAFVGTRVGCRLGRVFGGRAEIAGGVVLWAIGIRILLAHLLG
ncbi:MAG: manganese efflux pump [Candidatus Eisenbacteria bacterium]|nr:manganese efflux pump [Candidatus Eisenbacteria bacterium]